jgi:hypothetical protein
MATGLTKPAPILNYSVRDPPKHGSSSPDNDDLKMCFGIGPISCWFAAQWLIAAFAAMVIICGLLAAADMWAIFGEDVASAVAGMWIIVRMPLKSGLNAAMMARKPSTSRPSRQDSPIIHLFC